MKSGLKRCEAPYRLAITQRDTQSMEFFIGLSSGTSFDTPDATHGASESAAYSRLLHIHHTILIRRDFYVVVSRNPCHATRVGTRHRRPKYRQIFWTDA
jgi:hypothetical protein